MGRNQEGSGQNRGVHVETKKSPLAGKRACIYLCRTEETGQATVCLKARIGDNLYIG
jgi:hypothetical protein